MNNRTLDRPQEMKDRLRFAEVDIDEKHLCEMKNLLLQKETTVFIKKSISSKRSTSQKIIGNASKFRTEK